MILGTRMSAVFILSLIANVVLLSFFGYKYLKRSPPKQWEDYTLFDSYWQDRVAFFGILNKLHGNDVLLVGDSMFDRLPIEELWPDLSVANRGIGYDNSRALLTRLEKTVLDGKPRKVLLFVGGNDISKRNDLEMIVQEVVQIIKTLVAHKIEVCFVSLLPRGRKYSPSRRSLELINKDVRSFNHAVKQKCRELGVQFADVTEPFTEKGNYLDSHYTTDAIHLNAQGTVLLAGLLKPYLEENILPVK